MIRLVRGNDESKDHGVFGHQTQINKSQDIKKGESQNCDDESINKDNCLSYDEIRQVPVEKLKKTNSRTKGTIKRIPSVTWIRARTFLRRRRMHKSRTSERRGLLMLKLLYLLEMKQLKKEMSLKTLESESNFFETKSSSLRAPESPIVASDFYSEQDPSQGSFVSPRRRNRVSFNLGNNTIKSFNVKLPPTSITKTPGKRNQVKRNKNGGLVMQGRAITNGALKRSILKHRNAQLFD